MFKINAIIIAVFCLFSVSAADVIFNVTVPYDTSNPYTSITNECWIAGSFNNWNNNDKKLTKIDNTHYTITLDDATWTPGVTTQNVEYKYLCGCCDWSYVEKNIDGSELPTRKYSDNFGNDEVLSWTFFSPPPPLYPANVLIQVTVPKGTFECYIIGNFNNWIGPTAPVDSCKMGQISVNPDSSIIFEKTIFTFDIYSLQFHFCSGPDLVFEQSDPVGNYYSSDINPKVNSWNMVYDPTLKTDVNLVVNVPITTTKCWAVGSFQEWNMNNAIELTKIENGKFGFTIPNIYATECKLYNKKDWNFYETDNSGNEVRHLVVSTDNSSQTLNIQSWKQDFESTLTTTKFDQNIAYIVDNKIYIKNYANCLKIFNTAGQCIFTRINAQQSISNPLKTGLYFVQSDGRVQKVFIR